MKNSFEFLSLFKWVGNGLIVISACLTVFNFYIIATHNRADGVVVVITQARRGVQPTVQFQDKSGAAHLISSAPATSAKYFWNIGDSVPVYFIEDEPNSFRIGGFVHQYLVAVVTMLMGLWFRLIAIKGMRQSTS